VLYGIISDVHSNLAALQAVLAELERACVDEILFLGDIVGYGADANACVEAVGRAAGRGVRGNHDRIVAGDGERDGGRGAWEYAYSSDDVRDADLWNRRSLSRENLDALGALPRGPARVDDGILLCHGSPRDEDEYLASWEAVDANQEILRGRHAGVSVCFFGHTHAAMVLAAGARAALGCGPVELDATGPYFLNPGSVGQPRDGDPRAAYGVYDAGRRVYSGRRVGYDIQATQRSIVRSGLPSRFADRLVRGR
jgi:predicted phosphodiesterase